MDVISDDDDKDTVNAIVDKFIAENCVLSDSDDNHTQSIKNERKTSKFLNTIKQNESKIIAETSTQIDQNLLNDPNLGNTISTYLTSVDVKFTLCEQIIPNTITWFQSEHVLLIMNAKELVECIEQESFATHIESIQSVLIGKKINIIIYGLGIFLKKKDHANWQLVQKHFIDLNLICKCSYRILETSNLVALYIHQFTKAILQLPEKKRKWKKYAIGNTVYSSHEVKNSIKISSDGAGLKRLWQQVLTVFPHIGLDRAEAIQNQYPTLNHLYQAYRTCSENTGIKLLQDISIRRSGNAKERNIGPETSRKLYKYFMAKDPKSNIN